MDSVILDEIKPKVNSGKKLFNPFPGLRPFTTDESHLFFGREGQSHEVLKFLADNRFVALLGTSGSGKSSLMYCGVIPILQGGFITKAGADWQMITCRPGQNPVKNLADAIAAKFGDDEASAGLHTEYIYSTLGNSSLGLVNALKTIPRKTNENILLLVDQFEELFRFRQIKNTTEALNEVLAYINLLIETIKSNELPVYIVITMRSDFIGECAQYQDFTKFINDSHYLIPQMTREDFRQAIEGPVAVGGGSISPFLVQQLLNDIGDNPDQLPILQHALMRTWDYWVKSGNTEAPINLRDYENIGKLEKALSEHANEAYNELTQQQKDICQIIFKTLTEKGNDNRGVRRPTAISEITNIALCDKQDIIEVVENFRKPSRSFLTPGVGIKLDENTIVDISHESLMRIWDKLIIWVSEEYEAVQMYKRLAVSAEKYQLGETALWRPPDLQLAINWHDKQKPTLTWAVRHNPAFERTMVFLDTSRKAYQLEEENKIKLQKKALRRTRLFAIVLGSAAIVSIFFMINSFIAKGEAVKQTEIAKQQTEIAETEKENALNQQKIAEEQRLLAQQKQTEAEEQRKLAEIEQQNATRSAREALRQKEIANLKSVEAQQQRANAELSADEAKKQQSLAEQASLQAQKLRMLSISQSMAVKSLQIDIDTTLRALVAYQAFLLNNQYGGNQFNPDVYNGLYFAHKYIYKNKKNDFAGHKYPVRALTLNKNQNSLYSTGTDGLILKWNINNNTDTLSFYNTTITNRILLVSPGYNYLIAGCDDGKLIKFSINNADTAKAIVLHTFNNPVNWAAFINNKSLLVSTNKGENVIVNIDDNTIKEIDKKLVIKESYKYQNGLLTLNGDGKLLYINNIDNFDAQPWTTYFETTGKIARIDEMEKAVDNTIKINSIALSNNGKYLVIGDINGNIIVFDAKTRQQEHRLTGHTARINQLVFDKTDGFLASASNDGTVRIWKTDDFNLVPFVLADNTAWALNITFTDNSDALFASYADGKIRKWPTNTVNMANEVMDKIKRNFTVEEWQQYVAKDINYSKTVELP